MIGLENYKTATKNNWRKQCWNEIARRVSNKKNAVVLYLAAEQDLDRGEAIRRGFRAENLIAVDLRQTVVDSLRSRGKVAIQGRIEHVACAWHDVDVVYADFCCGFTREAMRAVEMLNLFPFVKDDCVFLFNFQRGRESKAAGEWIREFQGLYEDGASQFVKNPKNRAQLAIAWMQSMLMLHDKNNKTEVMQTNDHTAVLYVEHTTIKGVSMPDIVTKKANPITISYRSSAAKGLYFDTLIMNKLLTYEDSRPYTTQEVEILTTAGRTYNLDADHAPMIGARQYIHRLKNEIGDRWLDTDLGIYNYIKDIYEVMPRVSAAKAVRTMRNSGQLLPCSNF